MLNQTLQYFGISFISSLLLIVLSKYILQPLIRKPADYYYAEGQRRRREAESEEAIPFRMRALQREEMQYEEGKRDIHRERIWEESYNDIRKSLETAFAELNPEDAFTEEPAGIVQEMPSETVRKTAPETEPAVIKMIPLTKSGKPRKPSMKMKKDELIAVAESLGIDIPEKATKSVILDLINEHNAAKE